MAMRQVEMHNTNLLKTYKDLRDLVHDLFGLKFGYSVFWRYSVDLFFEICDYMTFAAALIFGAERRLYVLMRDYVEPWEDNLAQMKRLDREHRRRHRQAAYDPYDVKIARDGDETGAKKRVDVFAACEESPNEPKKASMDADVIEYATSRLPRLPFFTSDFVGQAFLITALKQVCGRNLLNRLAVTTASFLCLANILGMKGEIISCPHKDIYFLETNTKSESTDLANMFAAPASAAGRGHIIKCKPRTKLKQKYNPALDFFVENKAATKAAGGAKDDVGKRGSGGGHTERAASGSRRNSIDLYEEAATILGLTCSQTDDCKCIECQCHYFDFEDDLDFAPLTSSALGATGGEYYVDHNSSCAIQ